MSRKNKVRPEIAVPAASPGAPFYDSYKPYACLIFAGFLLYFRTVFFDFSYLDDNGLLENFGFISDISNLPEFFRRDVFNAASGGTYYRPIVSVVFMLDALWAGKNPAAYHFTNMALHLAACCLLFRLLLKLNCERGRSFFYAFFFTVHPVHTQAVAWIPGRNDILLALFSLLSFSAFLSFLEGRKWTRFAAHLLFLLLALLTKENAAALFGLCAFYLVFLNGRKPEKGGYFSLWAGWAVVLAGWLSARVAFLKGVLGDAPFDIPGSLAGNFPALAGYFGKIFFPFKLGIMPVLKDLPVAGGIIAAAAAGFLLYAARPKRKGLVLFGFLWFLLFLLPTFIQSAAAVASFREDRAYLAFAGLIFALAELDIPGTFKLAGGRAAALGGGVLCLFFGLAFSYGGHFRDKLSFWKKAVESSPGSAFNHNNLGAMYYLEGDLAGAELLFDKAAAINPLEPRVHGNRGLVYMDTGRAGAAEGEYLKEISLDPRNDNVYLTLGLLYYNGGFADRAELAWEAALRINPGSAKVYTNLAVLNYRKKDKGKAEFYVRQMISRGLAVPPGLLKAVASLEKS